MKNTFKFPLLMLILAPSLTLAAGLPSATLGNELGRRQSVLMNDLSRHAKIEIPAALSRVTNETPKIDQAVQAMMDSMSSNCLMKVCGAPAANWNAFNIIDPRKTESTEFIHQWEQDLAPLIAKDMKDELDFNTELAAKLSENMATATLNEKQTRALKSLVFFKALAGEASSLSGTFMDVDPQTFSISLDEEKLVSATRSLAPDTAQAILLVMRGYIKPLYMNLAYLTWESPLSARLHVVYPTMDSKTALALDAKYLIQYYKDIQENFGRKVAAHLIGMTKTEVDLLKAVARGKIPADAEADAYAGLATNLDFYHFALQPETLELFAKMNQSFDEYVTTARTNFASFVQKSAQGYALADETKDAQDTCRSRLGVRTALDASYFKRERAERMVKEIREAAKTVVGGLIADGAGRKSVIKQIDQARFVFPDRGEVVIEKFKSKLNAHREFIAAEREFLKSNDPEMGSFLLITSLVQMQKISEGESIFTGKAAAECKKIEVSTFSDFSVPPFGQISVSWATLAYPEYTVGVMSHELGHVVSNKIRSLEKIDDAANFYDSLNCVANRNPFMTSKAELSRFQNTAWSEEDWADHFSTLVNAEMLKRKSQWVDFTKNMACGMVLNDDKAYVMNSMTPTPNDPHSAALLRLFMLGTDTNSLPETCKAILNPNTCN